MQAFSERFLATSKTKFGFLVYKKMMIKGCRVWFTGSVQGVGFRWATQEQALQRGLCGWVKNCSDGSVEILAKGTEGSLSSFKTWLWQGSSGSRVSEIHVTLEEGEHVPDTFYIR